MRRPWLKFYPNDWRGDPRLRMCSLSARGLWIDLMTYMHEGQPYGHLSIDGVRPDISGIASLVGRPVREVREALAELEARGVLSRDDGGLIFSRRMVRDYAKEQIDHQNGRAGGNPSLKRGVNPPDKAQKPDTRSQNAGGDARARAPIVSRQALDFADELAVIAGHDPQFLPPNWVGSGPAMRVQMMLDAGWRVEVMRDAAKGAMRRKADGPPSTIRYFEKIFARAHEPPLPLPSAQIVHPSREVPNVQSGSQSNVVQAGLRRLAEFREIARRTGADGVGGDGAKGDHGDGTGNTDVRLLAKN